MNISHPLLFWKSFVLPATLGSVQRAWLFITAFGAYRAYLNGWRIGDYEMVPGWTSHHHRLQYWIFEVESLIDKNANNILSVAVAKGWYSGRLGFGGGKRHIYGDRLAVCYGIP